MSNVVLAQSRVTFQEQNLDNVPRITITGDPGPFNPYTGIPFRVYPAGCVYNVTEGSITPGAVRSVSLTGEMLSFSRSNSATLQYPPDTGAPSVDVVWALDEKGQPLGGVRFQVDARTGKVTASKPFTGLAKVGPYSTTYQRILYLPSVQATQTMFSEFPTIHVGYGVIAAYKDGGIGVHEVQIPTGPQTGTDKVELWRVVSQTVLDPEGEWEKPPTWGSGYTGAFPTGQTGPTADSAILKERVHEIGYTTRTGMVSWYDQFSRSLSKPFPSNFIASTNTPSFQPVLELRVQTPANIFPDDLNAQRSAAAYIAERRAIRLIR